MIKKNILFLAVFSLLLSLSAGTLMAQGKGAGMSKQNSPPFLIMGKLPHLTKMLIQQWDNPALQLTDAQKEKLLVVRKDTINGAKKLGGEIAGLEQQVVEGISSGKTPADLKGLVDQVAARKTQATMLHLACIFNTEKILDKEQMAVLTGKAGK